ncbi:gastric triacylglycerol lipase-like [Mya arenaria]|uniref:gastric triacylglycerol lipase-like n=1 Tax=Mya arenaria TaxID=6604 RepID=UPI0022E3B250|nr:gastric triacylglycerol lipase-like [Mya arenaria]
MAEIITRMYRYRMVLFIFWLCVPLVVSSSVFHEVDLQNAVDPGVSRGDIPEEHMNVTQLVTSKGYPCEEYDVVTKDGYILGVQRIQHGKTRLLSGGQRPVVLLQHGLLSSSADWVINPANESLGFLLADSGFDVWLGNSRGNTYSLRHQTISPDSQQFWDFSWDEMAAYDLPATVSKVLEVSGATDLVYIGYSQGSQMAFARLSTDLKLSRQVRLFVALAPVAYIGNVISPLRYFSPFAYDLAFLFRLLGVKDFLPSDWLFHWLAREVCGHEIPDFLCENILFLFGGFDYKYMNMTRIPVYVSHSPAGTSVKNIIHYAQSVRSGKFQKFDYGSQENMQKYNQPTPPQYVPGNIRVPVALYSGTDDWLAVPRDVARLRQELRHVVKNHVIPDWEHLDFTWAINGPSACFGDVIELIRMYYNIA